MPNTNNIQLTIGGREFDVPVSEELPVAINFEMEDENNFEQKKGSTAFGITVPATLDNSEAMNTFFNPMSEDYSPDNFLKDVQPFSLVANGNELMVGKAMLKKATRTNVPIDMEIDLYANNADWAIDNSELTLHDVVSDVTHIFDLSTATIPGVIDTSWAFDGTSETQDYVYAPVRYYDTFRDSDTNIPLIEMKPSLSLYWLLYRGFKARGYKIVSTFFDSTYFRRMVLPWTWGDFLNLKIDVLKCRASSLPGIPITSGSGSGAIDVQCSNDSTDGNFDSGLAFDPPVGCYNYDPTGKHMIWFYLTGITPSPGTISASFSCRVKCSMDIAAGLIVAQVYVNWYINATLVQSDYISNHNSALLHRSIFNDDETVVFLASGLNPGDQVVAEVNYNIGSGSTTEIDIQTVEFYTNYFRAEQGSTVDFKNHDTLKNFKWLDLLRGTIDMFNLQLQSDSVGKVVYIEPSYPYSTDSNPIGTNPGYYTGGVKDWTDKQDLNKITTVENYNDYEQLFKISLKDDSTDGIYKLINDRYKTNVTQALYEFPTRFKKGVREMENRFFGPVMHYNHEPFSSINDISPQLICIIPENIANTSKNSAGNVFQPKLAYYKGLVDCATYGGWKLQGEIQTELPFMFAVNYFAGGEDDPILTYGDQNIGHAGDTPVKGMGLFKRFFWQRFAIMRHGKKMISYMNLNNSDALDMLQREYKKIGAGKFVCIKINGYKPLISDSAECTFWLWYPVTQADYDNTYPSEDSVMNDTPVVNTPDPKYSPTICHISDIPT